MYLQFVNIKVSATVRANKMVNMVNHIPSVSKILKKVFSNGFLKNGLTTSAFDCTGHMKIGVKRRILASLPCCLNLPSNAILNNSSLMCTSHKLLSNYSCRRYLSTIDNPTTETDDEKRKLIEIEIELLKDEGHVEVPTTLTENEWQELVDLKSPAARQKFLRHLFIIEQKKKQQQIENAQAQEIVQQRRKQVEEELQESEKTGSLSYGLWRNSIFMKWEDRRFNTIRAHRTFSAALHGQHIVFDNSFDHYMNAQEKKDLCKQFGMAVNSNREHVDPFYFHICNFNLKRELSQRMAHHIPTLLDKSYPVDIHQENYLDHFPKDRLVYVTPTARDDMTEFDPNAVYVIPNLIRQSTNYQVEVAKVKKEGIRMQKLPIDRYLDWGTGTKSLPVNIVLRILLDFRHTGSWVKAFDRNIPKRKLMRQDEAEPKYIKKVMSKPQNIKKKFNYGSKNWFK